MKSIFRPLAGIVLASVFASPALAGEGLYLRLGGGASLVDEDVFVDVDFDPGYMATAAVGYNWFFPESIADLRVELEGSYRFNDTNSLGNLALDGEAEVFGAMVNSYVDFRTTWPVVPYLGVGFGAARVMYEDNGAGITPPIDDNDTEFTYQVMGGFNYDLNDHMAIGVEYRYFQTEGLELWDTAGTVFTPQYKQHSVLATITLGF